MRSSAGQTCAAGSAAYWCLMNGLMQRMVLRHSIFRYMRYVHHQSRMPSFPIVMVGCYPTPPVRITTAQQRTGHAQ